ncbi:MAG: TonB-dependent receptor [Emticicia sp.]|nr:TonB-dependent receptor [Emticicia sp.]
MKQYIYLLLLLPSFVFAQNKIRGKVTRAENGEALVGAAVTIKGTSRGTITDLKGQYELRVPNNLGELNIEVKFIGFKDILKTVKISGVNTQHDFQMMSNDLQLPDVVVSARRIEEFLQKVPVAASVVSASDIERRSVYSTIEALNNIPNMMTDSWVASQPTFSIRGLASNFDNVGFESTVALYVDDVYFSRGFGFNSTLFDIARIEVLRGPQGTLFGKNTVGGVINVVSETPEFANNGQLEVNFGNYGFAQFRGKYNTELIKNKLALRLTGAFTHRNGYINDLNSISNASNKTIFGGGRGSLYYKPNDKTRITGRFYYGQDTKGENTFVYGSTENGDPLGIPADSYNATTSNTPNTFERQQFGGSAKAEFDLKQGRTLTSITAYNNSDDFYLGDNDLTKLNVSGWGRNQKLSSFSQEIRVSSARDQKFTYVGGLYFLNEQVSGKDTFSLSSDFLPLGEILLEKKLGRYNNFLETATTNSKISSQSVAMFLSGGYKITDKLSANVGLRFTAENKKLTYSQPLTYYLDKGKPVGAIDYYAVELGSDADPYQTSTIDNVLSGDASLNYEFNPFAMAYLKYSRGFKGAGFNTSVSGDETGASLVFKPEYVNSYEFGFKSKFNERTRLNGAIFYVDYKNKQEILDQGYRIEVANAARTSGLGAELEFNIMYKRLRLDVSGGVIGMRYREFMFGEDDYSGNKLLKAPNATFSVAPQYNVDLGDKYRLLLGANINYTGKAYNDISNYEVIARKAATIVNARAGIMPKNGKWSIALWGKNLTNTRYIQHGFEYEWGNQISWSRPTYVGLEMYLNFF